MEMFVEDLTSKTLKSKQEVKKAVEKKEAEKLSAIEPEEQVV
jgi:hypothetical protein